MSDIPVPPEMTDPLLPEPNPFSFDEAAWAAYNAQQLRIHQDDQTMPWPLERLRALVPLADSQPSRCATCATPITWKTSHMWGERWEHDNDPGDEAHDHSAVPSADGVSHWQEVPARVADIRATFGELDHYKIALDEARHLAESLYAFLCRGADWPDTLEEFNPDLEHTLLPKWLSGEPDAPETWQTPHANAEAEREAGMDATREYDPDYGRDLDYDDEDQDDGHDYPAEGATYDDEPFEPDENDPNGGWSL